MLSAQTYGGGRQDYINGDYQAAYDKLRPLADAGDAEAQKMMGIMYDYGHGVTADPAEAMVWYKRSAEQGQPAVQYLVGAKYFKGENVPQDYIEAAKWWELADNGGQVDAQFNLGLMYSRGLGIEQNDQRAAELFLRASSQDHAHAQYSVAVMYAFGRGIEKDYSIALDWFTKSAEKSVAQAQYNLGIFYENGYGVGKDLTISGEWYRLAAAQGLLEAQNKLASMSADMSEPESSVRHPVVAEVTGINQTAALEYQMSEIPAGGIRREDWLLQQQADGYTIQIASVVSENDMVNFLKDNNLDNNTAYIQVVINDVTRYNAFYGVYDSYSEAELSIQTLPNAVLRANPWTRNFRILQNMIKQ